MVIAVAALTVSIVSVVVAALALGHSIWARHQQFADARFTVACSVTCRYSADRREVTVSNDSVESIIVTFVSAGPFSNAERIPIGPHEKRPIQIVGYNSILPTMPATDRVPTIQYQDARGVIWQRGGQDVPRRL